MTLGAEPSSAPFAMLRKELTFDRLTRVIDVGANPLLDAAPYAHLLRLGGCHVVGFEPQEDAYSALIRDKGPNESYYPNAVGDGSEQMLHLYASPGFASIFPPHPASNILALGVNWQELTGKIPFKTVRLDDLAGIGDVDLIKIDIQGGEALVLENAVSVLSKAVAVITEQRYYRLYDGEPMAAGVDKVLVEQGFVVHKFLSSNQFQFNSTRRKMLTAMATKDQVIDGDVVFIRDPAQIAGWTDPQVLHMCILAATVFSSHSLVLYCLDEVVRRRLARRNILDSYLATLPDELLSKKYKEGK